MLNPRKMAKAVGHHNHDIDCYNAIYLPQDLYSMSFPSGRAATQVWDVLNYIADTFFIRRWALSYKVEEKYNGNEIVIMEASNVATQ